MGIALVEPAIVPDTFVTGRLQPEDLGNGNLRMTFYVTQRSLDGISDECVIVARLVISSETVKSLIPSTMKALGISCSGCERLRVLAH
ncbi:hypothetical protein EN858_14855 [Mesorhizobium sp. M4B.F.Ca.ET.215.01.1.1]|uniref:hypothetical protein n=1 Tax=unclassified Mesorhizobium TaxID=325217 RepID=UPI0010940B3C|nr:MULTISPECIES: hypothetical protein [unclassified Mesorhizobium]TGQ11200.1 hypothetical protein EN858_14855 [Mesorhizobium sp. M4B.F.Ca.ET.215.01.1.1]TGR04747.1 hypothetical protein EN846_13225 [Mesorhizobium sp. M4B.F.Ca.ET.203.01.1.1]